MFILVSGQLGILRIMPIPLVIFQDSKDFKGRITKSQALFGWQQLDMRKYATNFGMGKFKDAMPVPSPSNNPNGHDDRYPEICQTCSVRFSICANIYICICFCCLFIHFISLFFYLLISSIYSSIFLLFSISFVPYHYTVFPMQKASLFSWHPRSGCGQRTDCTFRGWGAEHRETVGTHWLMVSLIMGVSGRNYTALGNYSRSFQK